MGVAEGPTTVGSGTGEYMAEVKRRVKDKGVRTTGSRKTTEELTFLLRTLCCCLTKLAQHQPACCISVLIPTD